jgi:hypothetical protein
MRCHDKVEYSDQENKVGRMRGTSVSRKLSTPLLALALLSGGCRAGSQPDKLGSISVTLQRTACYGTCPVYTVTIQGDGRVEYIGESHVDIPGSQKAQFQPDNLQSLLKTVDRIHFWDLQEKYFEGCTDQPTAILSLHLDGKSKVVSNDYGGCSRQASGPQVDLANLAAEIDTLAGTRRWIQCDEDCTKNLIQNGFDINAQAPSGETALLLAIRKGETGKVRLLLAAGATVDLADAQGTTPLMEAVMRGHGDIARELLAKGADVHAKNKKGFTALEMTGDSELHKLLIKAGARGR